MCSCLSRARYQASVTGSARAISKLSIFEPQLSACDGLKIETNLSQEPSWEAWACCDMTLQKTAFIWASKQKWKPCSLKTKPSRGACRWRPPLAVWMSALFLRVRLCFWQGQQEKDENTAA